MSMQDQESNFLKALKQKGITRRDFLKYCTLISGVLAMPQPIANQISKALSQKKRMPVVWLEMQDCAGCSESFLRASKPSVTEIILEKLSIDYHEVLMAASGSLAEEAKAKTLAEGGYLLVVEGSIPLKDNGMYCCIGGRSAKDLLEEAVKNAAAVIAVGSCATFGGIPKAEPNPTQAVGVDQLVTSKPVVNLSGCPVNVVNLTATVVYYLTFGKLPALDAKKRPLFAYGARIHDNCERRGHFDAGEFVKSWGDEGHQKGWCLYHMGCKGPETFQNCPTVRWNDGTSWPIGSGHGCIGCAEPDFWDKSIYSPATLDEFAPPSVYPSTTTPIKTIKPQDAAATGAAVGVILGVAATIAVKQLGKKKTPPTPEVGDEKNQATTKQDGKHDD